MSIPQGNYSFECSNTLLLHERHLTWEKGEMGMTRLADWADLFKRLIDATKHDCEVFYEPQGLPGHVEENKKGEKETLFVIAATHVPLRDN